MLKFLLTDIIEKHLYILKIPYNNIKTSLQYFFIRTPPEIVQIIFLQTFENHLSLVL